MKILKNNLLLISVILFSIFSCSKDDEISNTAPEIKNQNFIVFENIKSGEKIGTINATDINKDVLSFSINTNDNNLFSITKTGELSLASNKQLDFETQTTHIITVQVTDGKEYVTAEITITVKDIDENRAPVINSQNFTVAENILETEAIGIVNASDPDNDTLTFSISTNDSDLFSINSAGVLSLASQKELDYETKTTHTITVQVSDGKLSTTTNITINVTDVDDAINIPDNNFKETLVANSNININGDNEIQVSEAEAYTGVINVINKNITDLTGIEYFTKITELICRNNKLTILDLSNNTDLVRLDCLSNQLTSLDLSKNTKLHTLNCDRNKISSLDISNNTLLKSIESGNNLITSIDVSNKPELEILNCSDNKLTSIDISQNPKLTEFSCSNNNLSNIDVSKNENLLILKCAQTSLTNLDISNNLLLENLTAWGNAFTGLDISKNTNLKALSCNKNNITNLDTSNNTFLRFLNCDENQLINLNVSKNIRLEQLFCSSNKLTSIDISNNPKITLLFCLNNQLNSLNISNGNNASINNFNAENNPDLTCIKIDTGFTPPSTWRKDTIANYNSTCK